MSEPKKISFGFTKVVKKQELSKPKKNDVELIDCIEAKTIKVVGTDENKTTKGPLIIPLKKNEKSAYGVLSNLISIIKEETGQVEPSTETVVEKKELEADDKTVINGNENLEALAAKEIINELKKTEEVSTKIYNVPLSKEVKLLGEKESTLDDYENIPIADFGLAMLRGMGWEEGKGVGKNEKQVMVAVPELRPKGLGLGADRPSAKINKNQNKPGTKEEDLQIKKGAYVRIVMGKNVDAYGQIEGLDDDAGRLFVKMALGGNKLSLNEFMVEPVTKSEYDKNSRVLNSKKYEEYKNKEGSGSQIKQEKQEVNDDVKKSIKKEIYSDKNSDDVRIKKERHYSSDEDMNKNSKSEHNSRKDEKYSTKQNKSKKSHKKHKKSKRYSSEDSSSSEDRKKDKRSNYSPDRKKSSHRNDEKYSRSDDKYSRNDDKYSRSDDKYSRSDDKYSRSDDKYSRSDDKYSRSDDKYSTREDKYSRSRNQRSRSREKKYKESKYRD